VCRAEDTLRAVPRLLIAVLAVALAAGVLIGASHSSSRDDEVRAHAALIRRMEHAITKDARHRVAHHQIKGPILRTRCVPYQSDKSRYSCTALQFATKLSYTGQVYIAHVDFGRKRFTFHPYRIPLYLGI
jgi:hypothetical protein